MAGLELRSSRDDLAAYGLDRLDAVDPDHPSEDGLDPHAGKLSQLIKQLRDL